MSKGSFSYSLSHYQPGTQKLYTQQSRISKKSTYDVSPKQPQHFKRRVCIRYVNNPKTNLCAGCQKRAEDHASTCDDKKWDYKKCTLIEPTDAYGVLTFPGSHSKTANYIRVEIETKPTDMIEFLYSNSKDGWKLQRPQLILSITGGAQNFTIPHRMKNAFKRGLIKAASSTGAWIITGGTNTGVMRLVGEAVADELQKHMAQIPLLGIATWGKISMRDEMIVKFNSSEKSLLSNYSNTSSTKGAKNELFYAKKESDSPKLKSLGRNAPKKISNSDILLDPNHTHFILVDDGSEGAFGKEIEFRAKLEAELRKGRSLKYYENLRKKNKFSEANADLNQIDDETDYDDQNPIPMVLIVVQGGPNTLLTVEESIKQNIPVLVLADSKGCADLIANACLFVKPNYEMLKKLVEESKMFDKLKDTPTYENQIQDSCQKLEYIVSKLDDNLINVFKLDSEEGGQDIELAILRAFLNSRKNAHYENLKLALQWNRNDIAKTDIFTGEEEFRSHQLAHLMEMALIQNKPKFVELILENCLNLKTFLTVRRLLFLYNSTRLRQSAKKAPLYKLLKKKHLLAKNVHIIGFNGIRKFLRDYLFEDFKAEFLMSDPEINQAIKFLELSNKVETSDGIINSEEYKNFGVEECIYPEQNLFLWSLLMNRIEIAKIFWQIGEHQICNALFASKLLKSMSKRIKDLENELNDYAIEMEEMACSVLQLFDATSDDLINGVLLMQKIPYYKINCLKMAEEANCLKFLSLPPVQDIITNIWDGKIELKRGLRAQIEFMLCCLSFGLLAPFVLFQRKSKLSRLAYLKYNMDRLNISTKNQLKIMKIIKDHFVNYEEDNYNDVERNLFKCFCCKYKFNKQLAGDDNDDSDEDGNDDEDAAENISTGNELELDSGDNLPENIAETEFNQNFIINDTSSKNQNFIIESIKPEDQNITNEECSKRKNWLQIYTSRYASFMRSPRVLFFYDCVFFLSFLGLFSYMMLCDFRYYKQNEKNTEELIHFNHTNLTVDKIQEDNFEKVVKKPALIELILFYWIVALFVDEIHQFLVSNTEGKFSYKFFRYFDSKWNYIDVSGCLLYFLAFGLRLLSIYTNENIFIAARLIFALDLSIWFLRLLHCLIVFKSLGPKIIMIEKMAYDLIFFIFIIAIFVCSFGITTQATLFPENNFNIHLLKNLINKAYWPIYGEMKILDELIDREETCSKDELNCPDLAGTYFSYIGLMIYMVVANVLLINLLIAMFSSTFEKVQENTDYIWNFQRYKLVFEYFESNIMPPPLNLVSYTYYLIKFIRNNFSNVSTEDDSEQELYSERKFAEEFMKLKKINAKETIPSKLKYNVDKMETLEQKLNEVLESRTKTFNQWNNAFNWILEKMDDNNEAPYIDSKQIEIRQTK